MGRCSLRSVFNLSVYLIVTCLVVSIVCCQLPHDQTASMPNVLLIMTDDQGYGDLGCHGNPWIQTPNLDALYSESVRFTDFHVGTTCAPTRAGLLTGRNCNEVGVWHTIMGRNFLRQGEQTIADILQENGYRTGIFGKWHLGDNHPYLPNDRGFDYSVIHGGGGVGQTPDFWNNDYFDDTYFVNGTPTPFKGYCTDIWFDEATRFIKAKSEKPFFCYIATNAPHGPFHVSKKYSDKYAGITDIPNPYFYGMITNIDDNVGRIRSFLDESGLGNNTILIFMTDNGTSAGVQLNGEGFREGKGFNAGMRGKKGSPYEGGHRVPFFIHWPEGMLAHGHDVDKISSYTDVVPTLLDLIGIRHIPRLPYEGMSLASLLRNPRDSWPNRTIITDTQRKEHLTKWKDASIMTDEYRLIRGEELYDYASDPGQTQNIAAENPDIVRKMRQSYEEWWSRVSQRSDELNPIHVGRGYEEIRLTCHDIHVEENQSPAWHQRHVRGDTNSNGFWMIDVQDEGVYSVEIFRFPKTSGLGLNATCGESEQVNGGTPYPPGKKIDIQNIQVQIGEQMKESLPEEGANNARFEFTLKTGEQKIQTWLLDDNGATRSAYYAYLKWLK